MVLENQNLEKIKNKEDIFIRCDYCGRIYSTKYKYYKLAMKGENKKNSCNKCKTQKKAETTLYIRQMKHYNNLLEVCKKKNYTLLS